MTNSGFVRHSSETRTLSGPDFGAKPKTRGTLGWFNSFAVAVLLTLTANARADNDERRFLSFVSSFCIECHSGDAPEGQLRLDQLKLELNRETNFRHWETIFDRVNDREMPPAAASQPSETERRQLTKALREKLVAANRQQQATRGRVQFRRLNREQYQNTLRDLLALPNLEVASMLPADQSQDGFDNVGSALELSQIQIARYLDAANAALEKAISLEPAPAPALIRREARSNGRFRQVLNKAREAVPVGNAVGLLRQPNTAQAPWFWSKFAPPIDAWYRIRMKSFGFIWDKGDVLAADRTHVVTFHAVTGRTKRPLGTFDIGRSETDATVHDFTAFLRQGDQIQIWFETLDDRIKGQRTLEEFTAPGVAVEWLEVEGPFLSREAGDAGLERGSKPASRESYSRLFGDLPVEPWSTSTGLREPPVPMIVSGVGKRTKRVVAKRNRITLYHVVSQSPSEDARSLLLEFARRAFRRPVDFDEISDVFELVQQKLDQKHCFQESLRTGFQAILCSPEFLFLHEQPGTLDDYALAARLSYFLWQSLPDDELLASAASGTLGDLGELQRQVERLLDDERSRRFVKSFCGQWLDLRRITFTEPDEQLYPEFDQLLLDSMVAETHAYFEEMLKRDLGVDYLVDSDFAMVNERLATLYSNDPTKPDTTPTFRDVDGSRIRRVPLSPDSVRGGLLTQASLLKVTANGTTTSPVVRGAWFLDRIYGKPSRLPPPNISAIEPDLRGTITIREQLDRHRNTEACAVCHRDIDPPGFALESFDVIGGWRTNYRSLGEGNPSTATFKNNRPVKYTIGLPVDSSGVAPDGSTFADIREFRQILLGHRAQLARNLVQRLLTYATGASIQFADRETSEAILNQCEPTGYGLRSLIQAVVRSEVFRCK